MRELKEEVVRSEKLSTMEHDISKEAHPQVAKTKQAVSEVVENFWRFARAL